MRWAAVFSSLSFLACGSSGTSSDAGPPEDGSATSDGLAGDADNADGSTNPDAATGARLIVSVQGSAPAVWDNAGAISAAIPPTFTMKDPSVGPGTNAMAIVQGRLVITTSRYFEALLVFDNAKTFASNAAPSVTISQDGFLPYYPYGAVAYDAALDALWFTGAGTMLVANASALTTKTKNQASFDVSGPGIGMVYEPTSDRVIAGPSNGTSVYAFNSAKSAMGTQSPSFTVATGIRTDTMAIAANRIYAAGTVNNQYGIAVWKNASAIASTTPPDFVIRTGLVLLGLSIPGLSVVSDTLVACTSGGTIMFWEKVSSINADQGPTHVVQLDTSKLVYGPTKAILDPITNRLYVLESTSVQIFATPLGNGTLVAKLPVSKPLDMAIVP